MRHPAFLRGDMDTSFIETHRAELFARPAPSPSAEEVSATASRSAASGAPFDPLATLPPGMKAGEVRQALAKGKAASKRGAAADEGARPASSDLTSRQIAVIAASVAAFQKAKAETLDAAFEMSKGDAPDGDARAARSQSARLPGWKLAGRIATLRDR
jgi:hypothetical protein